MMLTLPIAGEVAPAKTVEEEVALLWRQVYGSEQPSWVVPNVALATMHRDITKAWHDRPAPNPPAETQNLLREIEVLRALNAHYLEILQLQRVLNGLKE
jgi:hypothetical protein